MRPHEVNPNGPKRHNYPADSDQKSLNADQDRDVGYENEEEAFVNNFSGPGSEGYERSGKLIFEEACEALWNDQQVDARHIEVSVEEGVVSLTGEVETREMKKRAEDCVEHISGVTDVMNNLKVRGSGNFIKDQIDH